MTIYQNQYNPDLLTDWVGRHQRSNASHLRRRLTQRRVRFAFYGRVSTEEHQDWMSSRQWQWDSASELIGGHGHIVAGIFRHRVLTTCAVAATTSGRSSPGRDR